MVPEYIEDPVTLADALQAGHEYVATLSEVVNNLFADMQSRGWASGD
jgi:hypothetical protein